MLALEKVLTNNATIYRRELRLMGIDEGHAVGVGAGALKACLATRQRFGRKIFILISKRSSKYLF